MNINKENGNAEMKKPQLPVFRYHPDPIGTGAFEVGPARICPCCGKESPVYYVLTPYCVDEVENLCPDCIADGSAAQKYDAEFVEDGEWEGPVDAAKNDALFRRTPGYVSWQGEHWLSCCGDYCAYLGTVGTKELREMGIADEVLAAYEERGEYQNVAEALTKDGSLCGYLFRCLSCGAYHLWVDSD